MKNRHKHFKKYNQKFLRGYSLIEAIVYISLASVLFAAVITASSNVIKSYHKSKDVSNIEKSAIVTMDRLIREIRSASSVDTSASCLTDPPFIGGCDPELGFVKLNKVVSGVSQTVRFYLSGGRVMIEENGVEIGPLTSSRVTIDALRFRRSATSTSEALRVELSIMATNDESTLRNFYNTAVLRGSYQ